ncbi:MAG: hydrogenase maturation protease [Phycisphaerales bacterium]
MKFDETDNTMAAREGQGQWPGPLAPLPPMGETPGSWGEGDERETRRIQTSHPNPLPERERGYAQGLMIVGIGNTLRRDDGAGVAVVERLRLVMERTGVVLVATHQLLPELAEEVAHVRDVVFIDARMGISPGRVMVECITATAKPQAAGVGHYVTPGQLLAISTALYGGPADQRAFVIGIGVSDMDHGEGLSDVVHHAVSRVTDRVYRAAMEYGCGKPLGITTDSETCDA